MNATAHTGPAKREQLEQLWHSLVSAFISGLENAPESGVKASFLDVVRAFLRDNSMNLAAIREAKGGMTNGLLDALRLVQEQAQATEE